MAGRTVTAAGTMDGAATLAEAADAMRRFARELLDLEREGWQLAQPIDGDTAMLQQAPAGEPYADPSSVTVEQLQAEFATAEVPATWAAARDGMEDRVSIEAASTIHTAATLRDAAERAMRFAAELDAAEAAGWRLIEPVTSDQGVAVPPG